MTNKTPPAPPPIARGTYGKGGGIDYNKEIPAPSMTKPRDGVSFSPKNPWLQETVRVKGKNRGYTGE